MSSDNITALLGLTIAGAGIRRLPRNCCVRPIHEGRFVIVSTDPRLRALSDVAINRSDRPSSFHAAATELIRDICDFSQQPDGRSP